jgi:hypothetical protein
VPAPGRSSAAGAPCRWVDASRRNRAFDANVAKPAQLEPRAGLGTLAATGTAFRRANIRLPMTSDGSPITRLKHALRSGDLVRVRAVAVELPYITLPDALAILELIEAQDEARFESAAVRWVGRLALEAPGLTLAQLHLAIEALDGLPDDDAKATLRAFARRARARPAAVARPRRAGRP